MADTVYWYCERVAPGLLGEPLNAVTNAAFLVAAWWLWRLARRHGTASDPMLVILLLLLVATGLGSFALHTTATAWGGAVDTAALSLCLLTTIFFGARRWLGWSWLAALVWPAGMIGAAVVLGRLVPVAGAMYLGPFATGLVMALWLLAARHPAGRFVATAVLVFVPSFVFRTLDQPLCGAFPAGTHFLWHCLNAVVLGFAIAPFACLEKGARAPVAQPL